MSFFRNSSFILRNSKVILRNFKFLLALVGQAPLLFIRATPLGAPP